MTAVSAPAKINLALVVGPIRPDGKHEVVTILQKITLADTINLEPAPTTVVTGFVEDTIVGDALRALAEAAGHGAGWRVEIEKRIPVAAGLGGGSADAAAALRAANASLPRPLSPDHLRALAARLGADVPFFLAPGTMLGTGDGSTLAPISVPTGYAILLALPNGEVKASTGSVYCAFDARGGAEGFDDRRARLLDLVGALRTPLDFAGLPPNDLASSPFAATLQALGAFRADVSGAGPTVYALFEDERRARAAADALGATARTWVVAPERP
ncbi:MAG: 4-(cytidine 5'-diphospho)-2-C-methyl-D-erythritol kinase [Actinobacteria bacterium]|nr:4-(cytidine 5'-diphospho)-2-C-methyl-D-erythritol kinase [Actinomycetota bacterium]